MIPETPRFAVTGMGSFSAAGANMTALWESAKAVRTNVSEWHLKQSQKILPVYAAGHPNFSPDERQMVHRADRSATLALAAAKEAWIDAGLQAFEPDLVRVGVVIGSSRGPATINAMERSRASQKASLSAYTTFSSISGIVASALQIQGSSLMTSATCISGAVALKSALQMIQVGELDIVLVGGVDAPLTNSLLEQFWATTILSPENNSTALQPFGRERQGTVLGEGSAFLVVETEDFARRRGAPIRGFIDQVTIGCEPSFRTGADQDGEGLKKIVSRALDARKLNPKDIDLLHLHGTGTKLNDRMESNCVRQIFGDESAQPSSWATKALTGHTLGASPLFQIILTLEAMKHSFLPGSANSHDLDPACPLRLSQGSGSTRNMETALCLTSGFWGNISCVSLRRAP